MKFYGKIGYIDETEKFRGVWGNVAVEREAVGDILSNIRRWETDSTIADEFTTSNRISVLADGFLLEHISMMRYVVWNNTAWEIKSVEINRPRVIISLGGIYNGEQENPEEEGEGGEEETPGDDGEENQNGGEWRQFLQKGNRPKRR